MFKSRLRWMFLAVALSMTALALNGLAQEAPVKLSLGWNEVTGISRANVSIQVCPEPPMYRGSPIHDQLYKALHDLRPDDARLQPWFPYPHLAVAELKPPANGKTYWDFSLMDEITEDFMQATKGHPVVFDFGTIPEWMFKTASPVKYPKNRDQIDWDYGQGTELRDPSMQEVVDYFARLASWYIKGGFKDEYGKWHASGHHYKIAYWEVLNEPDLEHRIGPELYTRLYDAIVAKLKRVSPRLKFIGLALSNPIGRPQYFQYFLDQKNHKPGIPIDMISYHFYSMPSQGETLDTMQYTIFNQADKFLTAVRYIQSIRQCFSPETGTNIDEVGSMLPNPQAQKLARPIPGWYWNLAGAMWAYLYGHLAGMDINAVGAAELIDYPGQFAATTLVNWATGRPNARYWVVKLLRDNFGPGDKLVSTHIPSDSVYAQAFITPKGKRKILLVNKRDRTVELSIAGGEGAHVEVVVQGTASSPARASNLTSDQLTLRGLAVAVVTLK